MHRNGALQPPLMRENLPAHLTDNLARWIINETEVGTSAMLDRLSQTELQFLAGAMMAKSEERPKSDHQLLRYLRATKRLQDRASGAHVGR